MIIRATIANLRPDDAAALGQAAALAGTVYASLGFGPGGVEPRTTFEFAGETQRLPVRDFILDLLKNRGETCAYVTTTETAETEAHGGVSTVRAFLLYADGHREEL